MNKLIKHIRSRWASLGPGLITGASDDDPSGIATYSQAGAGFGLATLWTALITYPLMVAVQEMCARIGLVTRQGLAGIIKKHYPRWLLYAMIVFTFPAITFNIGADIAGMGAVANLLIPQVPVEIFSVFFMAILILCIVFFSYQRIAAIMKWLCIILFVYFIVPFLVLKDWEQVFLAAITPDIEWNREFIIILVAILGTTISPYLFFWQTSMYIEEMNHRQRKMKVIVIDREIEIVDHPNIHELKEMRFDVNIGMAFSNLVMFFIILTTGTVLYNGEIYEIETVQQAAEALRPLAGKYAYFLFALGILGTGFLAIPVLAGSLSYILAETFDWPQGMDKKFYEAKGFYITMIVSMLIALTINFTNFSPIEALIYTAVVYGITAPILIAIILHICNNEKIMGRHTNSRMSNVFGMLAFVIMSAAALALIFI